MVFVISNAVAFSQTTIIPMGAVWKYLDNGTNQGTAWQIDSYDDSGWASGPAPLGYAMTGVVTTVGYGPSSTNKYITTYFRKTINVTQAVIDEATLMKITLNIDDGAVVYVNGTEVMRNNMPTTAISYTTLANVTVGSSPSGFTGTFSSSLLTAGTNTIAVEIHQAAVTSSDIYFDLSLVPLVPSVSRGPYLQIGTPTSIVVRWLTDIATDSKVSYGTDSLALSQSVIVSGTRTNHTVQLTGLTPYTKYYYSVGSTTRTMKQGGQYYFLTSPLPYTENKYTFWVNGDCGNNSTNQANVVAKYLQYVGTTITNGVLLSGDNAYTSGTEAEFTTNFFNVYQNNIMRNSVFWSAPGNHDYSNGSAARQNDHLVPYYDIFDLPTNGEAGGVPSGTEAFYSFDYGNVHFLSLDSYGKENNATRLYDTLGAQVQWIKQDLAANDKKWVIAYWHHPPYTMGSHNSDTESELVNIRQNFIRILERMGVDLILTGHSHDYERSKLMKGHYGNETSFNSATHNLSQSSGKYDGSANSCTYLKDSLHNTLQGTVYVVSGSAGQLGGSQASFPHDAMYYSNATNGGSLVLEIEGNRLDAKWVCADGVIRDNFTMIKDASKVKNFAINLGESVTAQASWVGQYNWSHNGSTARTQTLTPSSTQTFIVTDQYQCVADTFKINVTIPTVTMSSFSTTEICAGATINIPFVKTGKFFPGNSFILQLSDATGSFASAVNIGTLNDTTSGTISGIIPTNTPDGGNYRLRIITSLPFIISSSATPGFVVNETIPSPTLTSSDADNSICLGDAVDFTASGAIRYEFFVAGISQGAASTQSLFSTTGLLNTQTVEVKGYNACGSDFSQAIATTVISSPVINISTSATANTICTGETLQINASGADTYEFFVDNISQGAASATSVFSSNAFTNGQEVKVVGNNACFTNDNAITVTVNTASPVIITSNDADNAICLGNNIAFTSTGTNVQWFSDLNLTNQVATGNIYTVTPASASVYSYYAIQTDANNCTSTPVQTNLTVNPLPFAPTVTNQSVCRFQPNPALTAAGSNINWYSNPGLTTQVGAGNSFVPSNTLPGNFNYYATQTDANGCVSLSAMATLTINTLPAAPNAVSQVVCEYNAIPSLTATGTTIIWYSNPTLTTQVATGNTFNTGATSAGVYSYYLTQTDANGCTSPSNMVSLVINATPSAPVISGNTTYCSGDIFAGLNAGGSGISWYNDSGLNTLVATGNNYTPATAGVYYATQTVSGCVSSSASVNVIVNSLPAVAIGGLNTNYFITDAPVVISGTPSGGSFSGQGVSGNVFDPALAGVGGPYTISYNYTDANGCSNSSSTDVSVTLLTSITNLNNGTEIVISPNPANDYTIINLTITKEEITSVILYDVLGKTIVISPTKQLPQGKHSIELNKDNLNLNSGIYWLKVRIGEEEKNIKIIFQ